MSDSIIRPKKGQEISEVKIVDKDACFYDRRFLTLFPSAYAHAVIHLTARERKVLDVLMAHIRANNIVRLTRDEVARELGIPSTSVSAALSVLRKEGIIYTHHQDVHEINPAICWFGKVVDHQRPPRNPKPHTHDKVEIVCGEKKVAIHFPKVLTNTEHFKRYPKRATAEAELGVSAD